MSERLRDLRKQNGGYYSRVREKKEMSEEHASEEKIIE